MRCVRCVWAIHEGVGAGNEMSSVAETTTVVSIKMAKAVVQTELEAERPCQLG